MKLLLLVALLGVAYVAAECPEACNGHGFCGEYDKCSCYRNWQGNSCADRTCPFDFAFVDIPHGDLDMSGNLDDTITTYGAQINDIYAFEVYPTDGYQINRGATDASSDDVMYTTLTAKEKAASFYDMAEDGHFYAECSNKGMCDRKSGQCDCFDGYSGTACRRVACPNDCSGHGTCETIAETSNFAYALWDRYKTQVCSCDPGYFGIDCAQRHCPYGDDPLSTDEHNEIQWLTLRTHGDGTNGPVDTGDSTYTAGDLDLEGTFRLAYLDEYGETWNTSPIGAISYDFATAATNTALASAIKAALEGIPNSVFEEVDVEVWPIQTPIPGTYACNAAAGTCVLTEDATNLKVENADVLEFAKTDEQTSSTITGGVHKWGISNCLQAGTTGWRYATAVDFTTTAGSAAGTDSGGGTTLNTGAGTTICRYDMNGFRAKITFNKNPGDLNELTCDADLVTTGEHKDSADPATDIVCTAQDQNTLELGAINTVIGNPIGGGNGGQLQTNMDLSQTMTHGDRIKIGSDVYTIAGPIVAPGAAATVKIIVEEETAATAALTDVNTPAAVWYGKGTSERTECSHRGLCNHDEGLCECFTGYTHDDCSMQDALNA